MALKSCRECGKEVSSEAKECPHCGVNKPTWVPITKRNLKPSEILAVIAVVIVVFVYVVNYFATYDQGKTAQAHSEVGAYSACQTFVERRLVAPATADFPCCYPDYTTHLGGGRYRVTSYVDAENRFGAKLRTTFDCTVIYQQADNSWNLENLDLTER